jgi:hypothetical protein
VVIEHLKDHGFPDAMTRTRRDHMKFLTLIQAITLLYQHQREIKISSEDGEKLEYIEATEADVKLAWELANHVLMRSLDDVQTQTRRLLLVIDKMVAGECERLQIERMDYRFTRATVRQFTGWRSWNTWRCIAASPARASSTRSTSRWMRTAGRCCRG